MILSLRSRPKLLLIYGIGYESDASLGPQSSVDLSEYCGALSEWETTFDLDHEEDARKLPFLGLPDMARCHIGY